MAIFNIMTLGLTWPITALTLGTVQFFGRLIYTIGYRVSPNGRLFGVALSFLSLMALFVCNIIALIVLLKDIGGATLIEIPTAIIE